MAAQNNHTEILQKLWVWSEEWQLITNMLKEKLLLAKDKDGRTAWHCAAFFGKLEGLKTLWSFAKEVELNIDELLLAGAEQRQTALHLAAQNNHTEILQKLWVWTEEWQLNKNELKKKCYQLDKNGNTAWHHAACCGKLEALATLWSLDNEVEIKLDELLLVKTENGITTLHMAAQKNHTEILQKL